MAWQPTDTQSIPSPDQILDRLNPQPGDVDQTAGYIGADDVHFVRAGHRQAEIGADHIGLKQHARFGGVAGDGPYVEFFVELPHLGGVAVDDGDAVAMMAEQFRDRGADSAGTQDDDFHRLARSVSYCNDPACRCRCSPG